MPYVCTLELATSISHSTKPFCSPSSDQKMALAGKMMMYLEINSPGEVLHDIVRNRPNDIASMLPDKVHSCDLVEGQWGAVGSVICWNFTYDGKKEIIKQEIEEVNEENHKIVFKVLEARLVENIYKSFKIIFHIEPKGDGKLAAVTFEFEKVNPRIPYPTAFMDYLCDVFKGVDDYNSSK
ncbi:putative Bet v I/Major latex protein [Helianthus annuus]|nr:putative Bet v I/Major latex protein [Helianthus annuus]KAJ0815093.1 putative Bet v I/Major latex protein [Helianthus annuus]